ncbi:efflux RND transporter periplasmic adaptor subunit [Malikia granosa]|uniref:Efflux transporter periplasmic adaptor subunit n=1 Tax=Malikia granosa TaxID=263067 RepID=A0A2S9K4M1_9BURK|nr:efflux RND transporter periplasmic adaptor subunit [Malikia granosa]PRD65409.1 efflux transporter periplasmic adaptor subunit [Malikia granosa]
MTVSPALKRRLLLGGSVALLALLFLFVLLRTGPLAPVQVTVAEVKPGRFTPELFGIGTLEARHHWMLGPTAPGRLLTLQVDVGDRVRAGQLLAEMDPVDLDQRLQALDASIARASSVQAAAAAQQADARARRELALSNLRRQQELARQHFISAGALEARGQELASAEAALESARATAQAAAQDALRAKAERAALQQQRANARLIAPADAVVSAREAEPGSTVVAGQAVLRLIDPTSLWARVRLDQGRSAGLVPGLPARLLLRSRPHEPVPARVARVEWLSDSVTEERIAQLSLEQIPPGLSVGEMVEASIELPAIEDSLLLPAASLQRQGGATGVWRLQDGRLAFAPVQVGASSLDGQVQVLAGLKSGERVVVYSQKPLSADSRIQVVEQLIRPAGAARTGP